MFFLRFRRTPGLGVTLNSVRKDQKNCTQVLLPKDANESSWTFEEEQSCGGVLHVINRVINNIYIHYNNL